MCGIYLTNIPLKKEKLKIKLEGIAHRGPDFTGVFQQDGLSFGHTRLSILDLDERSNQPMIHEDYTLVFNGEIYNYKTLKKELVDLGHVFLTQSDSEVLLIGYKQWGKALVSKLNGMFAFSIYDKCNNEIFSARDRLGVKPFYYSWNNGTFEICSQIKPLAVNKTVDQEAIMIYLQTGYIPSPWSIYSEVKKLRPGYIQIINLEKGEIKEEQYWDLKKVKPTKLSYEEAKNELHDLLIDAVKIRLQADVPYGSFLSGGIDSALVSALANKLENGELKTFTVGFDDKQYDESKLANQFSKILKTNHNEVTCTPSDLLEVLPSFFKFYDEPFADSSAIPSLLLNKTVKPHLTVALSGDGGDESFLGYNHFEWAQKMKYVYLFPSWLRRIGIKILPLSFFGKRADGIKSILAYDNFDDFIEGVFSGFGKLLLLNKDKEWLKKYEGFKFLSDNVIQKLADLNIKLWLENDSNVKVDRASMAYGVEVRSPFLDYRVIEFARTLPIAYRFSNGKRKKILRDILSQYIPENIFDVPKKGFSIPLGKWMKDELKQELNSSLNHKCLDKVDSLNYERVQSLYQLHIKGEGDYSPYLWRVFVLSKWLQENDDK